LGWKKFRLENKTSQQFDEQRVHLMPSSGKIFVEGFLLVANRFFDAVDLKMEVNQK
jgi:hypothetical protein